LYPNASGCRIVIEVPDGFGGVVESSFAVPMGEDEPDDLEGMVLAVLGRLKPGEWIGGFALANESGTDVNNGNFRRLLGRLKRCGRVETDRKSGYRLKFASSMPQGASKGHQ
jgi:hypothetical protein